MKALGLLLLLMFSLYAKATVYTVINTNDSGVGSLRQAISSAVDGDIVRMDNSLLTNGSDTIHLTSPLNISKGITVEGIYNANDTIYVSGSNMYTIFYVGYLGTVTFKNLVLIEGNGGSAGAGAINASYSYGMTVDIYNCVIRNNITQYAFAGSAVYVSSTYSSSGVTLNIHDSEISNNSGSYAPICTSGGSRSEVYLTNTTVFNNSGSKSGAIYALCSSSYYQPKARVYLVSSTIVNNTSFGTVAIESFASTSNNQDNSSSLIDVKNSTIVYNMGVSGYGALNSHASSYLTSANRINIKGSILTLNSGVSNYGTGTYYIDDLGYNILSATSQDLNLSPLQNNGGFTRTMMPTPPSIVIDAGDASDVSTTQNSLTPVGTRDVGAAEYLVFCSIDSTTINENICQGSTYSFNNQTLSLAGLYYDTLVNSGGCDSIITLNLSVNLLPTVNINQNGASIQATSGYVDYVWTYNSSLIIGADSNEYTPTQNGTYLVTVTDTNGCENSTSFNFNTLSTDDLKLSNDISIYPNPTQGEVYIKSSFDIKSIVIYDYHGREVVTYNNTPQKLDFYGFKKGNYLIKIIDEKGNQFIERVTVIN